MKNVLARCNMTGVVALTSDALRAAEAGTAAPLPTFQRGLVLCNVLLMPHLAGCDAGPGGEGGVIGSR